mmetsp:Transcript_25843/g.40084  ORF Transcript_25843/g.40084 Transcript_25843/m.40084 type:complete len:110 (+) Transcript_25843:559-888(+)
MIITQGIICTHMVLIQEVRATIPLMGAEWVTRLRPLLRLPDIKEWICRTLIHISRRMLGILWVIIIRMYMVIRELWSPMEHTCMQRKILTPATPRGDVLSGDFEDLRIS